MRGLPGSKILNLISPSQECPVGFASARYSPSCPCPPVKFFISSAFTLIFWDFCICSRAFGMYISNRSSCLV